MLNGFQMLSAWPDFRKTKSLSESLQLHGCAPNESSPSLANVEQFCDGQYISKSSRAAGQEKPIMAVLPSAVTRT
jgi:hypothetical protein